MMIRQNAHTKANPDTLGHLAQGTEQDLWTRRTREPGEEMVLHKPEIVEAHLVGQGALFQRLFVQCVPIDGGTLKRSLRFVEEAKLHCPSPWFEEEPDGPAPTQSRHRKVIPILAQIT